MLSLVSAALAIEPASTFTVLYGNRAVDSMMFAEELADLKNRHRHRLHLVHAFSREDPRLGLPGGRLDQALLAEIFARVLPPDSVREWFLCGPAGLVRDARAALAGHGVQGSAVHTEIFHPDEPKSPVGGRAAAPCPGDRSGS